MTSLEQQHLVENGLSLNNSTVHQVQTPDGDDNEDDFELDNNKYCDDYVCNCCHRRGDQDDHDNLGDDYKDEGDQ